MRAAKREKENLRVMRERKRRGWERGCIHHPKSQECCACLWWGLYGEKI